MLLEKRPPSGIWGGLWSLPEVAPARGPCSGARDGYGIEAVSIEPLAPFEHAFTHFTLEVLPWRIEARGATASPPRNPRPGSPLADLGGARCPRR